MTLGAFHFGIIDTVLVVMSLLFAYGGYKNGFFKEVFGLSAFFGAIGLSFLLGYMAEPFLLNSPLPSTIFNYLRGSVFVGNSIYETVIDGTQAGTLQTLTDGLNQMGIPGFISAPLAEFLMTFEGTLGDGLATAASGLAVTALAYLATFLVAWIILAIIGSILSKLIKSFSFIKVFDSVLGIFLGLFRGALLVILALTVAIPVSLVVPQVSTFLIQDLALGTPAFSISKFVYEYLAPIITSFLPI